MAAPTLFPEKWGVKLTAAPAASKIAPMPSLLRHAALSGCIAVAACNEGLQPTPICPPGFVGICGIVTFQGALPESTQAVYVVAYHTFPHSRDSLFKFQPPVTALHPLALGNASAFYAIPVETGRYEWV